MQIRDLMSSSVVSITPTESAALASRLLSRHNLGSLPVCSSDGTLRGIVTDRDIITRCVAPGRNPQEVPVEAIMTRDCAVISPEENPDGAARRMAARQVRRLPVLESGKVVGMLSLGDLSKCRACDMEAGAALSEISENVRPPQRDPS